MSIKKIRCNLSDLTRFRDHAREMKVREEVFRCNFEDEDKDEHDDEDEKAHHDEIDSVRFIKKNDRA